MADTKQAAAPATRVLVIGLDGATWTNLQPLMDGGDMPTLARLRREGAWGVLNSTIPALTPPAWASLVTGTNPGRHGVYHFRHAPPGDRYQRRLTNGRDIRTAPIWRRLNAHGRRVGVMNVPLSHPLEPVDGFITTDAFAPDTTRVQVHPPELADAFGDYVVDVDNYPTALPGTAQYAPQMLAFIEANERVLASQADAAVRLMHSQAWQFFMVGWMVTDRLGHFAWKYSDPALAATLTTAAEQQIGARVRAVFRSLDAQIARLLEAAGPGTAVAIVSDHGFGPVPAHFFNTNRWLIQRGYLRLLPALHPLRALVGYLPRAAKVHLRVPMDSKHGLVDWPQTMAWADPLESRAAGIYLNREDRYAAGIVAADQWRSLRDRLANELAELRAPGGDRLFSAIHTGETLYRGPATAEAPDLVAILARDYDVPPSFRRDVRASTLIVPNRHVLRDGGHEPEGIYLLWGENIRAAGGLPPQPIEALVPTVLQLFGLPLEDDLDAEPITAALREEFVRAFPPRRGAAAAAPTAPAEYSSEDSAAVEERLRNLGYMD